MNTYLLIVLLLAQIALAICIRGLKKYTEKKSENQAQKEDLNELTAIVEKVKTQFERGNAVHRIQFEAEFETYRAVWRSAFLAYKSCIVAFPSDSFGSPTAENFARFVNLHQDSVDALEGGQPFITAQIYRSFLELDGLLVDCKNWGAGGLQSVPDQPTRTEHRRRMSAALEGSSQAIRSRIESLTLIPD